MGNSFCINNCNRKSDTEKTLGVDDIPLSQRESREFSRVSPSEVVPLVNNGYKGFAMHAEGIQKQPKSSSSSCFFCLYCCCCGFSFVLALTLWAIIPFYIGHILGAEEFL
jgi:hypothetical protein